MNRTALSLALAPAVALAACATGSSQTATAAAAGPQDQFWAALSSHCGKAYAGGLASNEEADADMRGRDMAMHVRECSDERIAIPFHIRQPDGSWNRSRTWLITRTADGLRLKHDHRHEDGSEDDVTMYGGDTAAPGSARVQDFPVDAESVAMFEREGLGVSVTNVWRVAVDPAGAGGGAETPRFEYRLMREGAHARDFRVSFDLSRPVPAPPAPWGHD
ncbi:MAG: hypothetical protein KKE77_09405 [Alphaproteobacteria bacterium]|nr:hypothetical protein [Alphaproteobacteria bacterium]MBU2341441.1 hypothetical protein [Alphaproteobacteria bacterium]